MFSEILKITPQITSGDLNSMEKSLNGRFMKVAKSFGEGLKNVLLGGGVVGATLAIIDKILSPLKEAQEALDKTLNKSADVTALASQFQTSTGNIQKLHATGKQLGLDPETLDRMLEKFQAKVAEAQADPGSNSAVRNFVGSQDMVVAFADFIQNMQKMDKNQQVLVQENVFGEKFILRMAQFVQGFDKKTLAEGPASADLTASTKKLNDLDILDRQLAKQRELKDIIDKSNAITQDFVIASNKSKDLAAERENIRLKNFEKLASLDDTVTKMGIQLEKIASGLGTLIQTVTNPGGAVMKAMPSALKHVFDATTMDDPTGRGL
jgi:hypothetical protein